MKLGGAASQKRTTALRWLMWFAVLFAVMVVCAGLLSRLLFTRLALTTGPNGVETPATLGLPFERDGIPSGRRRLDNYLVRAPSTCVDAPVILIFHGVQETISEWVRVQKFLYDHCISSVVFDPTGSGNSPRPASFSLFDEDSTAAYRFTRARFPERRIYLLGHSMGNGTMLSAEPLLSPQPNGVIVANAFGSIRTSGVVQKHAAYRWLALTVPDWWNDIQAVSRLRAPLLVVHSDADHTNALEDGLRIYAAAPQPKTMVVLHGFGHNALVLRPVEAWWNPVLRFVASAP